MKILLSICRIRSTVVPVGLAPRHHTRSPVLGRTFLVEFLLPGAPQGGPETVCTCSVWNSCCVCGCVTSCGSNFAYRQPCSPMLPGRVLSEAPRGAVFVRILFFALHVVVFWCLDVFIHHMYNIWWPWYAMGANFSPTYMSVSSFYTV